MSRYGTAVRGRMCRMNPGDEERFHNGDTLPDGIPVIGEDGPPPPPGGYRRPVTVPVLVPDNTKPRNGHLNWPGMALFGAAVFTVVFVALTMPGDEEPATPAPAADPAQSAPVEPKDEMTCSPAEIPVSRGEVITCAREAEACALGSHYVPLNSNCGQPPFGNLLPVRTGEAIGLGDCVRLVDGSFETGTVTEVRCGIGADAKVIKYYDGYLEDLDCHPDNGSRSTFLAHYAQDGNGTETLCLAVPNLS